MAILLADKQITLSTNSSLSAEGNLKLLIVLAILSLVVAIGFVGAGAWLVLPFAGLELLAFAYAFYVISLHVNDTETITVIDDKVIIESKCHKKNSRAEFNRYWAQVHLRKQDNGKSGLFIGSHGKEVELGKGFINEEQRAFIAKELKLILKKND